MGSPADIRKQWELAAPGWARWEQTIARWTEPATEAMLEMAGISPGDRVLDLAAGAGSQTLQAALRVGPQGHIVASDIAQPMLEHVSANARAAGVNNISTLLGAAEDLNVPPASFDAAICRMGLMLFARPAQALAVSRTALRPGGRISVVVFSLPAKNPFMAQPMEILLRHAGRKPPAPGQPGIFALANPGALERLFEEAGFEQIEKRSVQNLLRMQSSAEALAMMQEAFGAYRAVINDSPEAVRTAAWSEVGKHLETFQTPAGLAAPGEFLVAAARKPL